MNWQVHAVTETDTYSKPLQLRKVTVCFMARELYHATWDCILSLSNHQFLIALYSQLLNLYWSFVEVA